jgi:hypothetical protein
MARELTPTGGDAQLIARVRAMPSPAASPEAQEAAARMKELLREAREAGITQEEIDYLLDVNAPEPPPRG